MITLVLVLWTVVMQFSILNIDDLIVSMDSRACTKGTEKYLWEFSLNLNGYVIKLVHLMLAVS